jgi:hypothetical protein
MLNYLTVTSNGYLVGLDELEQKIVVLDYKKFSWNKKKASFVVDLGNKRIYFKSKIRLI